MNISLLLFGLLLFVIGYLVGINYVKELIHFLKKRRVREQKKVAEILGGSHLILGAALITLGGLGFRYESFAILIAFISLLIVTIYIKSEYVQ